MVLHLLVCIERAFLDQGIHTSWETLRRQLSTHQVVTVRLPTVDGRVLTIRRDTRPEKIHSEIYRVLRLPQRILLPINRWTQNSHSTRPRTRMKSASNFENAEVRLA